MRGKTRRYKRLDKLQDLISQWAKESNIPEDNLTCLINKLKEKNLCWHSLDKNWKYPEMGDNQRSCPMLNVMFHIEHGKGIILYLPYKEG